MLALVKQGKVEKMTQRRVCASLNQWCRGPGLVISSFPVSYTHLTLPTKA